MKNRSVATVLVLLFGPAVIILVSRPLGLAAAIASVVILVYLVLRNERAR